MFNHLTLPQDLTTLLGCEGAQAEELNNRVPETVFRVASQHYSGALSGATPIPASPHRSTNILRQAKLVNAPLKAKDNKFWNMQLLVGILCQDGDSAQFPSLTVLTRPLCSSQIS